MPRAVRDADLGASLHLDDHAGGVAQLVQQRALAQARLLAGAAQRVVGPRLATHEEPRVRSGREGVSLDLGLVDRPRGRGVRRRVDPAWRR